MIEEERATILDNTMLRYVAVVGILLFIANSIAQYGFLYWEYRWLDIPMHFFGGVWVALIGLYFVLHTKVGKRYVPLVLQRPVWAALGGALLLGLLWEGYEVVFKFLEWGWFPDAYLLDTLLDVVMDMLGGVFVWLWYVGVQKMLRKREG